MKLAFFTSIVCIMALLDKRRLGPKQPSFVLGPIQLQLGQDYLAYTLKKDSPPPLLIFFFTYHAFKSREGNFLEIILLKEAKIRQYILLICEAF